MVVSSFYCHRRFLVLTTLCALELGLMWLGQSGSSTAEVNAVNGLWGELGLRVMQTEYEEGLTNITSWNIKSDRCAVRSFC